MFGLSLILLTSLHPQLQPAVRPTNGSTLTIAIDGPVYTGQPVWVRVLDPAPDLGIRYPFYSNIGYMGCNRLDVKRNGELLTRRDFPLTSFNGFACGSAAPRGSPENRLPLHVLYPISEAGTYSVQLITATEPAQPRQSQWLSFTVLQSTPKQHETWLKGLLAQVPQDEGQLAGDFLPSLMAAAPDPRALDTFPNYLYSENGVVSGMASSALEAFPPREVLRAVAKSLERDGPSDQLAYFASYHTGWTPEDQDKIVHAAIRYLQPQDSPLPSGKQLSPISPVQTAAAIKLLRFIFYIPNQAWPTNSELRSYADARVLEAATNIMANSSTGTVHELSLYLGAMDYSPRTHRLLLQISERNDDAATQARICLTWHPQPEDLACLAGFLTSPGDADDSGRERAILPCQLVRAYGDRALPHLEKAVASSPYIWVRVESADILALHGRPIGFQFLLDQLIQDSFPSNLAYKPELTRWVCENFPKDLPSDASEDMVINFLHDRIAKLSNGK